ncbi:hypothetical protein E6O75_ATG07972 [Venturia nashicola]|uniref:Uncharacterized protein n=1 Tax=Venturia nashicola TaxID=86259 RepID=A0A4Z1NWD3_9PEZI|nr:hypothetical protein E6O75_ATG07972 [Venturia nashicola]
MCPLLSEKNFRFRFQRLLKTIMHQQLQLVHLENVNHSCLPRRFPSAIMETQILVRWMEIEKKEGGGQKVGRCAVSSGSQDSPLLLLIDNQGPGFFSGELFQDPGWRYFSINRGHGWTGCFSGRIYLVVKSL